MGELTNIDWKNVYDFDSGKNKFIFVSYSHKDAEWLRPDVFYLFKAGVRMWFDPSLKHGEDWSQKVRKCFEHKNCIGACFYLSPNSVVSNAIAQEIQFALDAQKTNPDFKITSVSIGKKTAFQLLREQDAAIDENEKERYYRLYLEAFPKEVLFFNREEEINSVHHLPSMVCTFEEWGARNMKINYSAPEEFVYVPFQNGIKIIGYNGNSAYPNVPSEINGKRVLSLGMQLFGDRENLKSVTIQEGIETIEEACFRNCSQLESVTFPVSIRHLAYESFRGCASLQSVVFHKHIKSLGDYCFYQCKNLTSVTFDSSCSEISLGFNCFQDCESLTDITLPVSAAKISMYCFNKCENLRTLRMPSRIETMDDVVIHNCPMLEHIDFPGFIPQNYNGRLVKHCHNLKEFACKNKILNERTKQSVENQGAQILIHLDTPVVRFCEQDMSLRFDAIAHASGYTAEISYKDGNTVITDILSCTPSLIQENGGNTLALSAESHITETGHAVLNLTPYSQSVDSDCLSFSIRIRADGEKSAYADSDFSETCVYRNRNSDFVKGEDPTVLLRYVGTDTEITIPEHFKTIGDSAFSFCETLKTVRFPYGLQQIENKAFYHCTALENIDWGESLPEKLGDFVFAYCQSLENIVFPASVHTIGASAFEVCSKIRTVDMSQCYVPEIRKRTFRRCISLTTVHFSHNLNTIGDEAFRGCTALIPEEFPSGLVRIGKTAFSFLMDAETIRLPAGIREVSSDFLFYSTEISRIEIGKDSKHYRVHKNTLHHILETNLEHMEELVTYPINNSETDFDLPAGIIRILPNAFRDIERLETALLDDDLIEICSSNFSYCWNLQQVTLGKNVQIIRTDCFSHNPALKRIIITSDTLPEIGDNCFAHNHHSFRIEFQGKEYRIPPDTHSVAVFLKTQIENESPNEAQ